MKCTSWKGVPKFFMIRSLLIDWVAIIVNHAIRFITRQYSAIQEKLNLMLFLPLTAAMYLLLLFMRLQIWWWLLMWMHQQLMLHNTSGNPILLMARVLHFSSNMEKQQALPGGLLCACSKALQASMKTGISPMHKHLLPLELEALPLFLLLVTEKLLLVNLVELKNNLIFCLWCLFSEIVF